MGAFGTMMMVGVFWTYDGCISIDDILNNKTVFYILLPQKGWGYGDLGCNFWHGVKILQLQNYFPPNKCVYIYIYIYIYKGYSINKGN